MILTIAKMDGYFKIVFLLSLTSAVIAIKNGIQLSEVDVVRHDLMKVESDLVQRLNISSTMYNSETRKKAVTMIIEAYAKFGSLVDDEFPNTREKHLEPLQSLHVWAKAENILRNINGLYTTFRRLQQTSIESHSPVDEETWKDFSKTILFDANVSILTALYEIFDLIVDEKLYASAYQEGERTICNNYQSPQQLLYNLYNSIAVTELKGYTMMQFSWLLLKLYKNGNFSEEIQQTKTRYEARMAETSRAVQTAMTFASPDLWKCDPQYPRGPETSTELNWFLQSYIVNELDLNDKNTCGQNCAYYSYAEVNCNPKDAYCKKQRKCNGAVYNCQYVDSDMWICPAGKNSNRRYEYIEYENGRVLGEKGTCSQGTTKVDSWWRWLFWHCSYCICSCDEQDRDSDRFFNLRKVVADVDSNKVITGIKFVKVNGMIHLQIEQGQLLESGTIGNVTEWKPVEKFSIYDNGVNEGTDFLTLSWHQRAIDLDDLKAPPGHLMTGVKFRKLGAHVNLEIMTTPFNFTTGTLLHPDTQSVWHGNDNTDAALENPRTLLALNRPDKSTRSQAQSIPDSKHNQYMMFGLSDLDKDAGQSIVPFIDTQPVAPYPRVPIAGAGIYHKGRPEFGGYIAPKLITYNFAPHLHSERSDGTPLINNRRKNVITRPQFN
ncbi:uncharacterized protein LOC124410410 isoform X2 [Diprion similis]|uniref:uncharacterized protein LOC124410410 isoform X2 n=1 Tax=Diprion similis TaxID=362088 RepID=UPI001EF87FF4|nr:uncharacterized protein LOC124410410 isoform X2 [Diprion similis]XP_046744715.1 uncharacterized protein LOC124410410 isoform X2 [Diprion similis]XP_046744716.1 uncharacterized protein LOC124410410 isoform X2 [Diprion similis]